MQKSQTFAATVEQAYDVVCTAPLTDIFSRRYLAIAAIAEVTGQEGEWGEAVGQTRTIRLTDGATMLETLIAVDRPHHFDYSISELTGPLKMLVSGIDGRYSFEPDGGGVTVTWRWVVTPKGLVGKLAMPVFAAMWSQYASRAMGQIQLLLVA
jgi:hypothetical protein